MQQFLHKMAACYNSILKSGKMWKWENQRIRSIIKNGQDKWISAFWWLFFRNLLHLMSKQQQQQQQKQKQNKQKDLGCLRRIQWRNQKQFNTSALHNLLAFLNVSENSLEYDVGRIFHKAINKCPDLVKLGFYSLHFQGKLSPHWRFCKIKEAACTFFAYLLPFLNTALITKKLI